jgi:hypothetical protein
MAGFGGMCLDLRARCFFVLLNDLGSSSFAEGVFAWLDVCGGASTDSEASLSLLPSSFPCCSPCSLSLSSLSSL